MKSPDQQATDKPVTMRALACLALLITCLVSTHPARAGAACNAAVTTEAAFTKAMALAVRARTALDESGAEVALIARVGQDLSGYGLRYSHLAYVWRDHPQGRWLVVHELNECGTARSALFNQGLANFFMDDMFAYDSLIVIPGQDSQHRIAAMLGSTTALAMHAPGYNMLSYAWSDRYQNSNQWVLESYAASASDTPLTTRGDAQRWLKAANFEPITIHVNSLQRLGARATRANVAFDDHPFNRRMAGQIDTVTVEAVVAFIQHRDPGARQLTLRE